MIASSGLVDTTERKLDPLVTRLVNDAARAAELGDHARHRLLLTEAAERLFDDERFDEAIELFVRAKDFASAVRTAERSGDRARADALIQMSRRVETPAPRPGAGDPEVEEAERLEAEGALERAADVQVRIGDPIRAAGLLIRASQESTANGASRKDMIIRAAKLYGSVGQVDRAAGVLEKFGLREEARRMRKRAGREDTPPPSAPTPPGVARPRTPPPSPAPARTPSDRVRPRPSSSPKDFPLSSIHDPFERGRELLERARSGEHNLYATAIEALSAVDACHKDFIQGRTMIATALSEIGRGTEALRLLQQMLRGIDYAPEHLPALYEYGRLLELEGHLAEARSTYRMICDLSPTFMDVSSRLMGLGTTGVFELKGLQDYLKQESADTDDLAPSDATLDEGAADQVLDDRDDRDDRIPTVDIEPPVDAQSTAQTRPMLRSETPIPRPSRPTPPNPIHILAHAEAAPSFESIAGTDPEELLGVVLRGRFRFERLLGAGSQAKVFLARDVVLDRLVAIKVLDLRASPSEHVVTRFLSEARFGAKVHHPSALGVYDFGREGDRLFIALEYLEGQTLRDVLAERGSLPPRIAFRIARDLSAALSAVHKAGIIHRDVKPSNVMVDAEFFVRLADFGVATSVDDAEVPAGVLAGTLRYMAPEQGIGPQADPKSDIFSLGVVLYEMLSGDAPFEATVQSLIERAEKPPPELPRDVRVQESLRKIVADCLNPHLAKRPTARELQDALDRELAVFERERFY